MSDNGPAESPLFDEPRLRSLGDGGFALAMRMLCNREDAADAVQDALHALIRSRSQFRSDRGTPRAWFLKIVRNRCLDLQRRAAKRNRADEPAEPMAPPEERPDRQAEKNEQTAALQDAVNQLSEDQREIILLRDFHGLSYAEIAETIGAAAGTVMSRLHRARAELRSRMRRYE